MARNVESSTSQCIPEKSDTTPAALAEPNGSHRGDCDCRSCLALERPYHSIFQPKGTSLLPVIAEAAKTSHTRVIGCGDVDLLDSRLKMCF